MAESNSKFSSFLILIIVLAIQFVSINSQSNITVTSNPHRRRQNQIRKVNRPNSNNITINVHLVNPPATQGPTRPNNPCTSNIARSSCDQCIHRSSQCYWCNYDNTCRNLPSGQSQPFRGDCGNDAWHTDQCIITGNVLPIVIPVTAGVIAIAGTSLLCCMCCRYRSKRHVDRQLREIRQKQESERKKKKDKDKTVERAFKLEVVRQKYTSKNSSNTTAYSWENTSNNHSKLFSFNPFKYRRLDDANSNTITAV
ncbi:uncharacterized protein TRIADDRAFT_57629 [Trichoplax adhaerens]|uniref:PSI domain-containing protein n=1 Tax=Trichoplax adhaerens TaxID=10228 RepID=B3RZZ7_TRIAD|nr:hypothetical protein TRIADDRAFT_57629 [Trichoplax adhaerens]EDV23916.1 hypothetical protein TRIADDRAFT_57629 [Trichoplax adhaerens]|eukprot:XP_002113442.1 hypothetical protein TRIADDRAFT_57629 [Trichoplax adhaerens]